MRNPHQPLKLTEPHYVFCRTVGFRGTPVEKHRIKVINTTQMMVGKQWVKCLGKQWVKCLSALLTSRPIRVGIKWSMMVFCSDSNKSLVSSNL